MSYEIEIEVKGVYIMDAENPEQAKEATKEEMEDLLNPLSYLIGTELQVIITDVVPTKGIKPLVFSGGSIQAFDVSFSFKGVMVQTGLNKADAIQAVVQHLKSKRAQIEDVVIVEFELWVDGQKIA
jgi:hypothetical protein